MYLSVETSPFIRTSASPATTAATASRTQLTSLFSSTILKIEQSIPSAPQTSSMTCLVAVEGRFDQSLLICVVDGAERVGILAVGDGQPFAALFLGLLDDLREFCNHCCMKVRIKRFGRCFPLPVSGTAAGRLCRSVGECEPASLSVESKFFHRCGIIGII